MQTNIVFFLLTLFSMFFNRMLILSHHFLMLKVRKNIYLQMGNREKQNDFQFILQNRLNEAL